MMRQEGSRAEKKIRRKVAMKLHALPCAGTEQRAVICADKGDLQLPRYWKTGLEETVAEWG